VAILRNESSFLDQPSWKQLLRSMTLEVSHVPERSKAVISLTILMTTVPRLFHDVTEVVCQQKPADAVTLNDLLVRAQDLNSRLRLWYLSYFDKNVEFEIQNPLTDGYCKIVVFFCYCAIFSNRLLIAIARSDNAFIKEIENESRHFSACLLRFRKLPAFSNIQGALFVVRKCCLAEATLHTSAEWMSEQPSKGSTPLPLVRRDAFERWCTLFYRSVPSRSA
jgi:hypothetical protein